MGYDYYFFSVEIAFVFSFFYVSYFYTVTQFHVYLPTRLVLCTWSYVYTRLAKKCLIALAVTWPCLGRS